MGPDLALVADNPLGKIPCLVLDDGGALYDSRVICEYLDTLHQGARLFPAGGAERWEALRLQALADGIMDAALLTRYETFLRPEALRWTAWVDGQLDKVRRALDRIEAVEAPGFGGARGHRHDHHRLCPGLPRFPLRQPGLARAATGAGRLVRGVRRAAVDAGDLPPSVLTAPGGVRRRRSNAAEQNGSRERLPSVSGPVARGGQPLTPSGITLPLRHASISVS